VFAQGQFRLGGALLDLLAERALHFLKCDVGQRHNTCAGERQFFHFAML
jgi:hypothetical protein